MTTDPVGPGDGTSAVTAWFATRIGGVLVPLAATVLAFLIGGLVVAITGHNPFSTYKAIFEGPGSTGFSPGSRARRATMPPMTFSRHLFSGRRLS